MANNGQPRAGGAGVSGTGWMLMIVLVVVGGMMLMRKDSTGPEAPDGDPAHHSVPPVSQAQTQAPARPAPQPQQKRTAGKDGWSIEEVEVAGAKPKVVPASPTQVIPSSGKVTKKGDWAIEEIDAGDGTGAKLELRSAPPTQPKPEAKTTKKGDWTLEEVEDLTKPAGDMKLADPKDPKTTKKGDWELEVD